ncbi:MAG: hypothetical protein ABH914_00835 [Candidatus Omnitrophota bacterium]
MSKLPVISGKVCIKVLGKVGFYVKRQEEIRGQSHFLKKSVAFFFEE